MACAWGNGAPNLLCVVPGSGACLLLGLSWRPRWELSSWSAALLLGVLLAGSWHARGACLLFSLSGGGPVWSAWGRHEKKHISQANRRHKIPVQNQFISPARNFNRLRKEKLARPEVRFGGKYVFSKSWVRNVVAHAK